MPEMVNPSGIVPYTEREKIHTERPAISQKMGSIIQELLFQPF